MHEKAVKAHKLKGEDLNNFIDAKGISSVCTACGHDGIMILSHGPDQPLQIFAMHLVHPEASPGESAGMAGFICQNCGHISTFAAATILQWKEEESPHVG